MLLLLAGCPLPESKETEDDEDRPREDAESGETGVEDTEGPVDTACAADVTATQPTDGASDVYVRDTLVVEFSAAAPGALLEVADSAGPVPFTASWLTGDTRVEIAASLSPSTNYALRAEPCGGPVQVAFSTSDLGTPLVVPAVELAGQVYVTSLADLDVTTPAFFDGVADLFFQQPILVGIDEADDAELSLRVVPGQEADGAYVPAEGGGDCGFTGVSFLDAPWFDASGTDDLALAYYEVSAPLEALGIAGVFTSDGAAIRELRLTGAMDTRHMGDLVGRSGDANAICEIASQAGVYCTACADGEQTCLDLVAEGEAALDLTATIDP